VAYRNLKSEFVAWLRLGTKAARLAAGEPPTIVAWAEKNNVSRVQCQRWKAEPDVKRAVADHGLALFTIDEVARARERLVERAIVDGNVPAIKMLLEWAGVAPNKGAGDSAPPITPNAFAEMTDEEIEAALADDEDDE